MSCRETELMPHAYFATLRLMRPALMIHKAVCR
jgi:hypothetical protein